MEQRNTVILEARDIERKSQRIAYQIVENNYDEKEIVIVGIKDQGYQFAQTLVEIIRGITKIPVSLYSLELDKRSPGEKGLVTEFDKKQVHNRSVILVDDVANTGKTLAYALRPLLDCHPKKIQVAVLVDRRHKLFPITADFVGVSLATTLKEHIAVSFVKGKETAYLS